MRQRTNIQKSSTYSHLIYISSNEKKKLRHQTIKLIKVFFSSIRIVDSLIHSFLTTRRRHRYKWKIYCVFFSLFLMTQWTSAHSVASDWSGTDLIIHFGRRRRSRENFRPNEVQIHTTNVRWSLSWQTRDFCECKSSWLSSQTLSDCSYRWLMNFFRHPTDCVEQESVG